MKFASITSSLHFASLLLCSGRSEAWSTTTNFATRTTVRPTTTSLKSSESSPSSDFNVVLAPSSDPEAFDSFKTGTARVHRYARDDSDGDSEGDVDGNWVGLFDGDCDG